MWRWRVLIWIAGVVFLVNGLVHWAYLFGWLREDFSGVPATMAVTLTWYSHLLAVADVAAAVGLFLRHPLGWSLAVAIMLSQFPTHGAVIAFKMRHGLAPETFRFVDLALSAIGLFLCSLPSLRALFRRRDGRRCS